MGKDVNKAQGIAFHHSFGSYCAEVAEASVTDRIEVKRMFAAIDCGGEQRDNQAAGGGSYNHGFERCSPGEGELQQSTEF